MVDSRKSLVELVTMKGLKVEFELAFLRSLGKALLEAFKDDSNPFTQGLAMAGPAFALSTKMKSEFTFKDFKEVEDHPMASKFVLTLSEILKKTVGSDLKELKEKRKEYDHSHFDPEKLQAIIDKEGSEL